MPQLVGTADPEEPRPLARALRALGLKQALLAHQPLHPLATHALAIELAPGNAATIRVASVGLTRATSSTTRSVAPNGRR
jgi:hypothetical protein